MTELTTAHLPSRSAAVPTPATGEPTLITEQQVRFATAAAVTIPAVKTRRWAAFLTSAMGSLLDGGPSRPVYRLREAYLENALMCREMERL